MVGEAAVMVAAVVVETSGLYEPLAGFIIRSSY
jgi:hypothetical protein